MNDQNKTTRKPGKRISRRDFMGGAAAAMAFTIVPSHVLAQPPSEKLNVAAIGQADEFLQRARPLGVDEIDALKVEHNGVQRRVCMVVEFDEPVGECIRAGEKETGIKAQNQQTWICFTIGVVHQTPEYLRTWLTTEHVHVWSYRNVYQPTDR